MRQHQRLISILVLILLIVAITPVSSIAAQQETHLSDSGPWLLYLATAEGETLPYLWGINANGTGLTRLSDQPVVNFAVHPHPQPNTGSHLVAYVGTAPDDLRRDLALYFLSLPDGGISDPIPLTSAETGYLPDSTAPDGVNTLDIAAALAHTQSLAWSPDGQWLAFVGAMDGPSADLYSYQLANGTIRRLSDGPHHAYQLLWTPDASQIIHSANACFLCMGGPFEGGQGIWGAYPDGSGLVTYEGADAPARFVLWKDASHLLIDSGPRNGCWSDARILNIADGSSEPIDFGCYGPVVYNDTGSHALLHAAGTSDLLSDGMGLYTVNIDRAEATYFGEDFDEIWWDRYERRFMSMGDQGLHAFTREGEMIMDFFHTSHARSPNHRFIARIDTAPREQWEGGLWLETDGGAPVHLLDGGGLALEWSPDSQGFFFSQGAPGLYLIVANTMKVLPLFNQPGLNVEWPYNEIGWQATWVPRE